MITVQNTLVLSLISLLVGCDCCADLRSDVRCVVDDVQFAEAKKERYIDGEVLTTFEVYPGQEIAFTGWIGATRSGIAPHREQLDTPIQNTTSVEVFVESGGSKRILGVGNTGLYREDVGRLVNAGLANSGFRIEGMAPQSKGEYPILMSAVILGERRSCETKGILSVK